MRKMSIFFTQFRDFLSHAVITYNQSVQFLSNCHSGEWKQEAVQSFLPTNLVSNFEKEINSTLILATVYSAALKLPVSFKCNSRFHRHCTILNTLSKALPT